MAPPTDGHWAPSTYPKQDEIRWAVHPDNPLRTRDLCVSGPRYSSKTIGCMHALVEHAWEVKSARIAIIAPTVTSATDGGCWTKLVEETIPQWIAGDFGVEWHRESHQSAGSRHFQCSIRNKHGTISVFQLETFREGSNESDITARFKGREFSAIYISEAGTWIKTQLAYDILPACFRKKPAWTANVFTFIVDTNPEPPGENHWIFQLYYKFRRLDDDALMEIIKDKPIALEDMRARQKRLGLVEVFVSDNLGLEADKLSELKSQYADNQELWDRYYLGKWTSAAGNGVFKEVFRPVIHVVGELATPLNENPLQLTPSPHCFELFTGWDLGEVNHAVCFLERFMWPDSKGIPVAHFNIIDEFVVLNSDLTVGDVTEVVITKMDYWQKLVGRPLHWNHFSDRSSFDYRDSLSARRQHVEVALVSKKRIILQAVDKFPGSLGMRVDIMRKLLFQDRIAISKALCPHLAMSIASLRPGKNSRPIEKGSEHAHIFDATTYPLQFLCGDEQFRAQKALFTPPGRSTHISIQL